MSKHQENHLLSEELQVQTVHPRAKSHRNFTSRPDCGSFLLSVYLDVINKYMTRDPCQPSLPSLCDSSKGWRDVNILQAQGKPSPTPQHRHPGASPQPGGLGRASPTHRAKLVTGHTKKLAAGAWRGVRPGAARRRMRCPHAAGTKPAGK